MIAGRIVALGRSLPLPWRDGPPPLAAGAELAPGYEVIGLLRRGEDLDVYDAWSHERLSRVVVKTPRPDRLQKASARGRLEAEGRLLREATHPHIVACYELIDGPRPAVVLETLSGETLAALLDERGALASEEVANLGLQLASALAYLHARGVLHLDLKPGNVIAEAGRAKLLDLSLARSPGVVPDGYGTEDYLSPEQDRGGAVDAASDVWGLGRLLSEAAAVDALAGDDPLRELLKRATASEPSDRPSLRELMAGLEPLSGLPPSDWRWSRR